MTIKEEMKPKKEKKEAVEVKHPFTQDYEEKKPKEKPKNDLHKHPMFKIEIDELQKCIKDKDKRISKLEKRLNDRIKYYYTVGVIAIFVLLAALIIYLCFVDIETLRIWMIAIGIIASILGSIMLFIVCMFFIWGDESDKEK